MGVNGSVSRSLLQAHEGHDPQATTIDVHHAHCAAYI